MGRGGAERAGFRSGAVVLRRDQNSEGPEGYLHDHLAMKSAKERSLNDLNVMLRRWAQGDEPDLDRLLEQARRHWRRGNSVYSTSAFPSRPTRGTAAVAAGAIMACASEVLSSRSRLKPLSGARLREEVIRRLEQQSGQSFLSA